LNLCIKVWKRKDQKAAASYKTGGYWQERGPSQQTEKKKKKKKKQMFFYNISLSLAGESKAPIVRD
jgi:hypothetical protein